MTTQPDAPPSTPAPVVVVDEDDNEATISVGDVVRLKNGLAFVVDKIDYGDTDLPVRLRTGMSRDDWLWPSIDSIDIAALAAQRPTLAPAPREALRALVADLRALEKDWRTSADPAQNDFASTSQMAMYENFADLLADVLDKHEAADALTALSGAKKEE